jgi:hypothetical protein
MRIIALDPSGNYDEGKGTTGYAVFQDGELEKFGDIKASDFPNQEQYWKHHDYLIVDEAPDIVLCESYRLFGHKAKSQSWSSLETPQLIGFIRMMCWISDIKFEMQNPSDKVRVADDQLVKLGFFEKRGSKYYCQGRLTNLHQRDSIRHGIFYLRYGGGKNGGLQRKN